MKTLHSWEDLRSYGIDILTGEACAYGYRVLCDVTKAGVTLFNSVFDMQSSLRPGWNDQDSYSIMMPRSMFQPLAIFALFTVDNCSQVFVTYDGVVYGIEASDYGERVALFVAGCQGTFCEVCKRYGKGGGIQYTYRNPGYSRNAHQMTGRVV